MSGEVVITLLAAIWALLLVLFWNPGDFRRLHSKKPNHHARRNRTLRP